ncbi:hypothetical protein D9M71_224700 [compost metagenome]
MNTTPPPGPFPHAPHPSRSGSRCHRPAAAPDTPGCHSSPPMGNRETVPLYAPWQRRCSLGGLPGSHRRAQACHPAAATSWPAPYARPRPANARPVARVPRPAGNIRPPLRSGGSTAVAAGAVRGAARAPHGPVHRAIATLVRADAQSKRATHPANGRAATGAGDG